jgi:hypothetical protein
VGESSFDGWMLDDAGITNHGHSMQGFWILDFRLGVTLNKHLTPAPN